MNIKIGFGFDVHQLVDEHPFFLGGVKLDDAPKGAFGHSDGDVLVHAICDALLGAANLRDIGCHFKNTDVRWKGVSSLSLLKQVISLLQKKAFKVGNIDCTVCLEEPTINKYIPDMQREIAQCIGLETDNISIKATTNESLGFVGRKEGVTAYAIALIYQ